MNNEILRPTVLELAEQMWGMPYIWGGDDPVRGFDCSGMVIELLQSVGVLSKMDTTADGLKRMFSQFRRFSVLEMKPGDLAFWDWDGDGTADHVEMLYRILETGQHDQPMILTIGAAGGGSKTKTPEDAYKQNAYIKVRPLKPNALIYNPFGEG